MRDSNIMSAAAATALPTCRVVVENFVGDREYIWTSSSDSYMSQLELVASELKSRIGERFYTIEVFKTDREHGCWEPISMFL